MFQFLGTCTELPASMTMQIVDDGREVTRKTFLKHVGLAKMREMEKRLGYKDHPSRGLMMANDYAVSYYRSKFRGRLIYYFCWSSIEFIFRKAE